MDSLRGNFGTFGRSDDGAQDGSDFDAPWDDGPGWSEEDDNGFAAAEPPPRPVGQDERRMQVRAYNHWASLLGERNFPSAEDLELHDQPDFADNAVLLDFTEGVVNPAIAFLGDALAAECAGDSRNPGSIETVADIPGRSLLSRITDHYLQILANQAPIGFEAEFINAEDITILYRGILLPFSTDGETIDFIYGVINWKEVADQLTSDELLLQIDQALADDSEDDEDAGLPPQRRRRLVPSIDHWADGPNGSEEDASVPVAHSPVPEAPQADSPAADPPAADPPDADPPDADSDAIDRDVADAPETDFREPDAHETRTLPAGASGAPEIGTSDPSEAAVSDTDEGGASAGLADRETSEAADARSPEPGETSGWDWDDEDPDGDEAGAIPAIDTSEFYGDKLEEGRMAAIMADAGSAGGGADFDPLADFREQSTIGLHYSLADARELARLAQTAEMRSRGALYQAVGRAYDVSLAARQEPEAYAELLEQNAIEVQDRAPMTAVVKLVFGPQYDRTRLAEYAAVLSFAQREGVARGKLADFLGGYDGGLKAMVAQERAVRRGENADASPPRGEVVRRKLGKLAGRPITQVESRGAQYAMLVIRRSDDGEIALLGEVDGDDRLLERAAKHILA